MSIGPTYWWKEILYHNLRPENTCQSRRENAENALCKTVNVTAQLIIFNTKNSVSMTNTIYITDWLQFNLLMDIIQRVLTWNGKER